MNQRNTPREPIAVVGMACRFPGAEDLRSFWNLLREGGDGTSETPRSRWNADAFYDADPGAPGKTVNRRGGFLEDVDGFDWRAFRISPRESRYMDPQHRLALEVAWEAIEDAGLSLEAIAGTHTGVYLGIMWSDYLALQARDPSMLNGFSATGNANAFAPGRISYTFDLKGPSVALDCACAGSVASVHAACQSLWLGEVSMALAGGVNLMLSPDVNIMLSKAGVLSREGRCKTLDATADGFVRGEGAGIVVLKPESAVTPSDRVYAFIRGSAMSHNGHNEWIMAASPEGQQEAIREACRVAAVDPGEIDYVELHGTALPKGDLMETKSLSAAVNTPERRQPCFVGSVKSNIGHLESAAGVASLIKVALSLHHRQIPPTLHLHNVNPLIKLEELALEPPTALVPWPVKEGGRPMAGLTAISMAGVNAHMVLEGAPADVLADRKPPHVHGYLLPLSARSPEALAEQARRFAAFLASGDCGGAPHDVCFTARACRTHHAHRVAVVGRSRHDLANALEAFCADGHADGAYSSGNLPERTEVSAPLRESLRRLGDAELEVALAAGEPLNMDDLHAVAYLYASGASIPWAAVFSQGGRCVSLPTYPWRRDRISLQFPHLLAGGPAPVEVSHAAGGMPEAHTLVRALQGAPHQERYAVAVAHVRDLILDLLALEPSESLQNDQGLFDVGLNSVGVAELMTRLSASVGQDLPSTLVFDYPTIERLARYLCDELLPCDHEESDRRDNVEEITPQSIEELSDEDAEAMLLERLRNLR
jgi:3-oxoacyl-[acyl-carrier-protein] synthase II